jgi:trigger factor
LEVKVSQLATDQQEVEVSLTYAEIQPEIQEAYREESKKIAIDGFRKGKAPIGVIKKLYGEAIEYKATEDISTKKFWDAVDQENLKPISTPQLLDIDFVPGSKLVFKVKYEIIPKLDLKDYLGLEVEKPIFKFTDDDVEKEIEFMFKPHEKFEAAELVENTGFRITVNLQRIDETGVPMTGPKSENILIDLNDEKVNSSIKESAVGKKVGDTFEFTFTDEHFHGEELHKEEFRYVADVTKIEKKNRPEVTEELIKKVSHNKASNLDELKEQISKNISDYYSKQSEDTVTNALLDKVVKNNDFSAPKGYVETVHKRMVEAEKENAKRYKMPNFDESGVSEYYKPRAEMNAKWQIVMQNIAEVENIKVEDAELEEAANKESEQTGISVAKLIKYYKDTNRTDFLLEDKVISFLKSKAVIKEIDAAEKAKEHKDHNHEH